MTARLIAATAAATVTMLLVWRGGRWLARNGTSGAGMVDGEGRPG